ncbi:uncharacterized protein LOC131190718 [Ahaetulla prasina]|uniref:uncharacterized protein LOC131190718 n=1 Tax=Ahaetulla prasina TaxID=499056 RepID=UPI002648D52A|nr:uncharacterized protein LOC131190718 [Ahaetulla prasina]
MTSKVSPLRKEGKNNQEKHTNKQDNGGDIPPAYSPDIQINNGEKGIDIFINFLNAMNTVYGPLAEKGKIVETIVETLEEHYNHPLVLFLLINCMNAVANLSKIQPPITPDLETRLLNIVLRRLIGNGPERQLEICDKTLYRQASMAFAAMLKGLLAEAPTIEHLHNILGHFTKYITSSNRLEKVQAIKATNYLFMEAYHNLGLHYDAYEMREYLGKIWHCPNKEKQ